ncbi:30S ribosomal protein S1 [Spatholobus suberectus]|nr:30S ribosomal protein S1 [Spatholobus suberectus]
MPIFSATFGSFTSISFLSASQSQSHLSPFVNFPHKLTVKTPWQWQWHHYHTAKVFFSGNTQIDQNPDAGLLQRPTPPDPQDDARQARRSSDWKAAKAYKDSGLIYNGRVEGFNSGGLLVRFYSILGFLPFPQLSPLHACKEPDKSIQEIAKGLLGSIISVKVILADEDNKKLIFSEKEAAWSKFSKQVNVGDIFEARVGYVEDYGAFVHLRFPDGLYRLTGLIHVSEVSWDLIHDVRDILKAGDEVRVKVVGIDWGKSRINLSIKQLEEDPLLETLDKVIPQDGLADSMSGGDSGGIEPLPGLETILEELLQEDGIFDVRISRQGFEKRVVSQDLQLWLSNAPPTNQRFTLLARAGRQVQEIHLTTSLDQEGIKRALQRVLERVP